MKGDNISTHLISNSVVLLEHNASRIHFQIRVHLLSLERDLQSVRNSLNCISLKLYLQVYLQVI